jgi:deoxycytidylate deaminase
MPKNIEIRVVDEAHPMMMRAKEYARAHSLDADTPTASVLVQNGVEISWGANGTDFHKRQENKELYGQSGCWRVVNKAPTGQQYDRCEGCSPKNHSEPRAIAAAHAKNEDLRGAELYLWGHWWCCESCCTAMAAAGITTVYILDTADMLFNDHHGGNILGRQFAV